MFRAGRSGHKNPRQTRGRQDSGRRPGESISIDTTDTVRFEPAGPVEHRDTVPRPEVAPPDPDAGEGPIRSRPEREADIGPERPVPEDGVSRRVAVATNPHDQCRGPVVRPHARAGVPDRHLVGGRVRRDGGVPPVADVGTARYAAALRPGERDPDVPDARDEQHGESEVSKPEFSFGSAHGAAFPGNR